MAPHWHGLWNIGTVTDICRLAITQSATYRRAFCASPKEMFWFPRALSWAGGGDRAGESSQPTPVLCWWAPASVLGDIGNRFSEPTQVLGREGWHHAQNLPLLPGNENKKSDGLCHHNGDSLRKVPAYYKVQWIQITEWWWTLYQSVLSTERYLIYQYVWTCKVGLQWLPAASHVNEYKRSVGVLEIQRTQSNIKSLELTVEFYAIYIRRLNGLQ